MKAFGTILCAGGWGVLVDGGISKKNAFLFFLFFGGGAFDETPMAFVSTFFFVGKNI